MKIDKLKKTVSVINLLIIIKYVISKRKRFRRWWVRPHLNVNLRNNYGAYNLLFRYFSLSDHEEFHRFVGMSLDQFINLHNLVQARLTKTSRRPSLPSTVRLSAVLCFLIHGNSVASTAWLFRISQECLYKMINEVCCVIRDILMPMYVQFPNKQRWLEIVNDYWVKWQYPNCLGALDGKHFRLNCPPNSGSVFYNYKKFYSIVMLALCDANYKITWFNLGDYGSCSDSSILPYTDLYKKMTNNELDIPATQPLPNTNVHLPLGFVADEIFPISKNLLKPFKRKLDMSYEEKVFNYRLKRARLTIECAFGILTSKFSILRQSLNFNLSTSKNIVAATVCLHNYIITCNLSGVCNENIHYKNNVAIPEQIMLPAVQRTLLSQYFTAPVGTVPWQNQYL